MKSLTFTLLAAIFCVALTSTETPKQKKQQTVSKEMTSKEDSFTYNFEIARHTRPGTGAPSQS